MKDNTVSLDNDIKMNIQHVVIAVLVGFDQDNRPLVVFSGNPHTTAIPASYTLPLHPQDVGCNVAVLLLEGDHQRPLIIGPVKDSLETEINYNKINPTKSHRVQIDNDALTITANKTITLACGDSSITLTKEGKILLRGKYISSCSSGMQTIKGGSVQIN